MPNVICSRTVLVRLRLCSFVPEFGSCFAVYISLYIPGALNAPKLNNKKLETMCMASIKGFGKFSLLSAGCCGELVGTGSTCTFKI